MEARKLSIDSLKSNNSDVGQLETLKEPIKVQKNRATFTASVQSIQKQSAREIKPHNRSHSTIAKQTPAEMLSTSTIG
jgi:hypothetical protein